MSGANIVHSGYGLRCEKLDKPLNLGWGLDNSAVLHWPGELPTGWLCDALDQIFIAEPQLSLMAWRSARILNRVMGRDLFDLSMPPALIQWRSGT